MDFLITRASDEFETAIIALDFEYTRKTQQECKQVFQAMGRQVHKARAKQVASKRPTARTALVRRW